ncbi:Tyrosine-protein phosphatase Lar-like [Toxocara canis]|uniref:Tyrosine-protein phosphatase Lar-like n=1 Tax=Toxocara canis TaxID=6265 RepID=A0A0B2V111_TOXCA|nr:Tyrosine-protein phosphatase Lar-like [Toxocara canis]
MARSVCTVLARIAASVDTLAEWGDAPSNSGGSSEEGISTAEYFDAIVNAIAPGPLDIPSFGAATNKEFSSPNPSQQVLSTTRSVTPVTIQNDLFRKTTSTQDGFKEEYLLIAESDFGNGAPSDAVQAPHRIAAHENVARTHRKGMLARGASADLKWRRRSKRALPSTLPNVPSNESRTRFKHDGSRAELGRLHAQWLEHHTNADDRSAAYYARLEARHHSSWRTLPNDESPVQKAVDKSSDTSNVLSAFYPSSSQQNIFSAIIDALLETKERETGPLVSPPSNIRVQATSNSSAVVQWDFDGESVDGFVVKYIHEPASGQRDSERWKAMTVMDPSARHLHIAQLTTHKPYAFCVLAIRQNRQGACSDPPTTMDRLVPTHMVSNLVVAWKTSNSVMLKWDYYGPQPIGFYVNQTGRKDYFDQHLQLKGMVSPGFRQELDGRQREHLWTTLRPYMEYTFHVGVRELPPSEKEYWPREVVVRTDPAGPPFVDVPEFIVSQEAGTALIKLRCASEEYGPISHYWLIVVPGNFTQDDVLNLDSSSLQKSTAYMKPRHEQVHGSTLDAQSMKKARKANKQHSHKRRYLHEPRTLRGAYIAAGIPVLEMQQMQRDDRPFTLGDGQIYDGYENWPLDSSARYRLMMRAFAKESTARSADRPFEYRAPMQEPLAKRYSDSMLSEPFSTKMAAHSRDARASNLWLVAPLVAVLIIALIVGMLVIWWLRCNKKGSSRGPNRHGSITKVALASSSIPSETSKLLVSGDVYGRQVMNPYDQMNANGGCAMETSMDMYPLHQSHHSATNYSAVPVPMPLLPSSGGVVGGHSLSHPPIPISELAAHIEKLRMNNNALFQQEYESIETGQHFTWEHSNMEENKPKNRYANVVAYDHSRVVLNTVDGISNSDYINANYIDGYEKAKAYIATQGPLPETFADFWRMVWEEGSVTIVMLTKLEERNRVKCDQYWPTRGSSAYGNIQVTLLDTLELAHYTIRTMRLQHRGSPEVRDIRHLQYTAWPDHGVPDHPTPFLMFLKRVKTLNQPGAGPIISHCSAGIGRTGAFIVIDCMLERLRYENTIDIYGCVTALRSQRSYMVQTDDQYVFIHDAVLDAVLSGSTEVPASKLYTHIQALLQIQPVDQASGMELEFRHLATLKMLNSRCAVANLPVNRPKNRLVNMVPYDSTRVTLHVIPGVEGSDYINASWVDGYRQRCAYIATQGPLPHTVNDFWRMIWENESSIVVMMIKTREMGREKCCEYWPAESGAQFGQLVIEPIAEYNMPQYVLREFRITDTQRGQTRTIRHFQYTEWPEQGPPKSAELFIDFIHQVHRTKTQFGVEGPITVHCSTGAGRTGVFIALSIIIDRMKLEHVVDVFTTVKLLRTERQNMVQDKEQYHFCYQAALEFLATYDNPYQMQ